MVKVIEKTRIVGHVVAEYNLGSNQDLGSAQGIVKHRDGYVYICKPNRRMQAYGIQVTQCEARQIVNQCADNIARKAVCTAYPELKI